jgi:hypothetical protein
MPARNTKGFAAYALLGVLAALNVGLQLACHKRNRQENFTQPPSLSYQTTLILPTAAQPFTSVAPEVSAYFYDNGVGAYETAGFSFSVKPPLPSGLTLDPGTGIISGTPAGVSAQASYAITASNFRSDGGGATSFTVTLGVQATSPVLLDYAGAGAASTAVGGSVSLAPPIVSGGVATGFGVSPALPAGLSLDPSSGQVSGTPTAALAATRFTLTATTLAGSGNAPFTLVVTATQPAAPLGLSYPALGPATVGSTYTSPAPTLSVPAVGVVYRVINVATPPLPAGLSLDANTGVIQWTPAAAGTTSFTVAASNGGGNSTFGVTLTGS